MIIAKCPNCGARHVQVAECATQPFATGGGASSWAMVRCQNLACGRLSLVVIAPGGLPRVVFPLSGESLAPGNAIPALVRADFDEAALAFAAGCFRASVVMSRRALQRCLRDQGVKSRNLADAIREAKESGVLRKAFHPVAEEVRQYGNLGAHPDDKEIDTVNEVTARHVLEFAKLLAHEFYEIPAQAALLHRTRSE